MQTLNILVDAAMPYWQQYFEGFGKVTTFRAGEIAQQELSDVQVLMVRSTTKVDQNLLALMPKLEFVGTATAGYDHFDIPALNAANIKWTAAGGCNASAVTQYVLCALLHLAVKDDFLLSQKRIGIVGHGNVGKRVKNMLRKLGIQPLIYDPPLHRDELLKGKCTEEYVSFDQILHCDVICIHAPFNSDLEFPSQHLFDNKVLNLLTQHQYLINAGRGELIDNQALLRLKQKRPQASVNIVLDVWENEPTIARELIPFCRLSTAHIAGHTLDGKAAGTHILYEQLNYHLGKVPKLSLSNFLPAYEQPLPEHLQRVLNSQDHYTPNEIQKIIKELCFCVYDIENDDSVFRRYMAQSASFAKLRQQYPVRREFSALNVHASHTKIQEFIHAIGFIISNGSTTPP